MNTNQSKRYLPLLTVRDMVVFLHLEQTIIVGKEHSIAAIEKTLSNEEKTIIIVTQRDDASDKIKQDEKPNQESLYKIATIAVISRMERLSDQTLNISIHGIERVEIDSIDDSHHYQQATYTTLPLPTDNSDEVEALHRQILHQVNQVDELISPNWPKGLLRKMLQQLKDPIDHVFVLCALLQLSVEQQQGVLEVKSRLEALTLLHGYLGHEVQILKMQKELSEQTVRNINDEQHKFFLRKQLEEIQSELGEKDPDQIEIELFQDKIKETKLPEEAADIIQQEMKRLRRMSHSSQDYHISRTYLEFVLELPWFNASKDNLDLIYVRDFLEKEHFGLKEIKDRIIEHLAIFKRNPKAKAPILCLVGPPGVGKTSIGASMAHALGRNFERISLGGLHDEAELRGHRKTYIGAMCGRIIQAIKHSGTNNPLILLDEIDKLGKDYRGDPSAALMEILDPSQNITFRDNYLEIPFDLSNVFFLTTANTLDTIPRPLLDRMEILRLSGYTEEEKVQIARKHLIPQKMQEAKLKLNGISFPVPVLKKIVSRYTREAGVRELSRQLSQAIRKILVNLLENSSATVKVTEAMLPELLGQERFFSEELRIDLQPGITAGLAWTEAGGEVLYVESVLTPERPGLLLTGQLGDVMKESAQTAMSYLFSKADDLGISVAEFTNCGVHVHVPAGATPKDGPSAGVTIATTLLSLLTQTPTRKDTAMTGEITLVGLVLPVGGVKEKILAARRAGIKRIILPEANMKDVEELDKKIKAKLKFIPVRHLKEVFKAALL